MSAEKSVIPLSIPELGGNAQAYIMQCLETNFVSSVGPFVERFEREFAAYVGSPHAVACANGTAAIHVALRLLDIGPGDEVWVSDFTFIASANPILYERAKAVLVDSEAETWNLDPERIETELRRRAACGDPMPKAIMAVHILGHPAKLAPIVELCQKYGITLIEDAAEALGSSYADGPLAGRQVGTIGRIGCYSFNGNKIITSGGGGMIVTAEAELARRAKHLTTQARKPGIEYDHDTYGYNYRLTNLAAALGVSQLERLNAYLEKKQAIAARYENGLGDLPGLTLFPHRAWARPSLWLYSVLLDQEKLGIGSRAMLKKLEEEGIQTRPLWRPLATMAPFAGMPRLGGAVADRLFRDGLSLPCSVGLSESDQFRVIEAFRKAAGHSF